MAISRAVVGEAALATELHLQIAVASVRLPEQSPGDALIVGRVVRVFRDQGGGAVAVAIDDVVEMAIGVCGDGDDVLPGSRWLKAELLDGVCVIEACASRGNDGVLYVADDQQALLDEATDRPALAFAASSPPASSSWSTSFQKRDLVFVISMAAFAVVGVFCVAAAFSILLP